MSKTQCRLPGCEAFATNGWPYCDKHHCTIRGCNEPWLDEQRPFCRTHTAQAKHAQNNDRDTSDFLETVKILESWQG